MVDRLEVVRSASRFWMLDFVTDLTDIPTWAEGGSRGQWPRF